MDKKYAVLKSWSFDALRYQADELDDFVYVMFHSRSFLEALSIQEGVFRTYIESVRENYEDHPYHNYHHAVGVTQFLYMIDTKGCLREKLSLEKRFGLFLAALNHDLAHPGKSASYQKELFTELYEKYGETSTLEKYHVDVAKNLWNDPETPVFPKKHHAFLETYIEHLIVSTDMQRHEEFFQFCQNENNNLDMRISILLIKCADLSQFIRGRDLAEKWFFRLRKELYLEKMHQLEKKGECVQEEIAPFHGLLSQQDFIDKIAFPLYALLTTMIPPLKEVEDLLDSNLI
ncbi:MAG: hypothetical protein AAGI90_01175 [Chlamydiota bacterium]